MTTRPPIGVEVVLERSGAPVLEAEVSGYDGDQVVLRCRTEPGAADTAEATLTWTTPRGVFRTPVVLESDGEQWRVTPRAAATCIQRREHVRLPMQGQITLVHSGGVERASLADLSEAALRVRLPASRAHVLQPGEAVRAAFTLHRTGFMLQGSVLRHQASDQADTVEVIVVLDIPARTANDLRRNVVFEQIRREADLDRDATPGPAPR